MPVLIRSIFLLTLLLPALARAGDLAGILAAYDAAFGATAAALAGPVRIEQRDPSGEQVSFHWQDGRYREEYRWLGFTEAFGYDGTQHWYGSDINLPYEIDGGAPPSITLELCRSFAFLREPWRGYLTVGTGVSLSGVAASGMRAASPPESRAGSERPVQSAGGVPTAMADEPSAPRMLFSPPGMAEALLALDGAILSVYIGDKRLLGNSRVLTETRFGRLGAYGAGPYPVEVETRTHEDDKLVRERSSSVVAVEVQPPLAADRFAPASSPPVPSPPLPEVPYSVEVEVRDGAVIVPCRAPDGTRLSLLLDTGANIGLLRRSVAARLGLNVTGSEQVSGHGAQAEVGYARAEGLRIGAAPLPAWPAAVLKSEAGLDESLRRSGVDGLLGNFLLHFYVVQIDYPARRLTLWPREQFDERAVAGRFAARLQRERLPYSEVVVDGQIRGGAYFNTGGRYVFGLAFWACDDAGITYPVESMGRGVSVGGSSLFGLIRPGEVRLLAFQVGQTLLSANDGRTQTGVSAPPANQDLLLASPPTTLEMLAPGEPMQRYRIGSFGNGFLRDYVVTFDLTREMVYLQRGG